MPSSPPPPPPYPPSLHSLPADEREAHCRYFLQNFSIIYAPIKARIEAAVKTRQDSLDNLREKGLQGFARESIDTFSQIAPGIMQKRTRAAVAAAKAEEVATLAEDEQAVNEMHDHKSQGLE